MFSWGTIVYSVCTGVGLVANLITVTEAAMRFYGRSGPRDLESAVARLEDAGRELRATMDSQARELRELQEIVNDLQSRLEENLPSPPLRRRNPHPYLD